ncbi:50S ribosomal protein L29 [Solitalea koreensis]|uniref:Large ribosomal subunit protein uL29 n=1 Tax=Solitalea koreensis TaxID=543615 RepID=A0A521AJE4_9SPHI|nr:50S ribosomal protein L29 [Solitalea koreensis]SMO34887.1 LSU ribosomal protein L29P [Solitalea koreensis]
MKYAEIKELTTEELKERIQAETANLTKFKFGHAVSALENPLKIKALRKDIARLNTELTQRNIAAATSNNQ